MLTRFVKEETVIIFEILFYKPQCTLFAHNEGKIVLPMKDKTTSKMHLISPPHDWFGIFAMSSLHGDDILSISSESIFLAYCGKQQRST